MNIKQSFIIVASGLCMALSACSDNNGHFISDKSFRTQVEADFEVKQRAINDSICFKVFDNPEISTQEREALEFLYAYMSISDISDMGGDFFLKQVRQTFLSKNEMTWGNSIPEIIFRHFVLPIRINNEKLDNSRIEFYSELKDRVKNLSLHDAALEVNHWCHEKVVYTPTDARTFSPLACAKNAYGRCGEEAVFAVAAMRAVGIPSRQVYTPRWAHTDDNHAWIEVWVDGRWFFMGACEPEPELNMAWFNAPAYRSLLMQTRVFGPYNGPEEIMRQSAYSTDINLTENYTNVAKLIVKVTNTNSERVDGANVEFKIYNYGEFCTVVQRKTNKDGLCSLKAGLGDMLVWAEKDGKFGYAKASFGKDDEVIVCLDKTIDSNFNEIFDVIPPIAGSIPPAKEVDEESISYNGHRKHVEDSIRGAYESSFMDDDAISNLAKRLDINVDVLSPILKNSRGNHSEIEKFLMAQSSESMDAALQLLNLVSKKDLQDVSAEVFMDNLKNPGMPYIQNPRIAKEHLTAYKSFLQKSLPKWLRDTAVIEPEALVAWVRKNIEIRQDLNPQNVYMSPVSVFRLKKTDRRSRNVFFVAASRSLGIPARIEGVTGNVQYFNGSWKNVDFDSSEKSTNDSTGFLNLAYGHTNVIDDPQYYSHFTISKIENSGSLSVLNFETMNNVDMGGGSSWKVLFSKPMLMNVGSYVITSGTRMADGKVLAVINSFKVEYGKTTLDTLNMREDSRDVQVIGSVDAERRFKRIEDKTETSILDAVGRGYFVVAVLGAKQEPTNHIMRDIANFKAEFEDWGRGIVLLFKNEKEYKLFDKDEFGSLPSTIIYGLDEDSSISDMLVQAGKFQNAKDLPLFVIADTFGRVVFVSQGYSIGLGEQMMRVIKKL